jgi:hypothetical protein
MILTAEDVVDIILWVVTSRCITTMETHLVVVEGARAIMVMITIVVCLRTCLTTSTATVTNINIKCQ